MGGDENPPIGLPFEAAPLAEGPSSAPVVDGEREVPPLPPAIRVVGEKVHEVRHARPPVCGQVALHDVDARFVGLFEELAGALLKCGEGLPPLLREPLQLFGLFLEGRQGPFALGGGLIELFGALLEAGQRLLAIVGDLAQFVGAPSQGRQGSLTVVGEPPHAQGGGGHGEHNHARHEGRSQHGDSRRAALPAKFGVGQSLSPPALVEHALVGAVANAQGAALLKTDSREPQGRDHGVLFEPFHRFAP